MLRLMLIAVLAIAAVPASGADRTVTEQVARMKLGRKIKVELNTGEILKGRMGSATAEQFNLEPRRPGQRPVRVIRLDEARSVRPTSLTTKQTWGVVIVVWVALAAASSAFAG